MKSYKKFFFFLSKNHMAFKRLTIVSREIECDRSCLGLAVDTAKEAVNRSMLELDMEK